MAVWRVTRKMRLKTIKSKLKITSASPFFLAAVLSLCACTLPAPQTLLTIADARNNPAQIIDIGEPGDSVGDILVFDQPLLDKTLKPIGNNSGSCIRTRVGHSFQCQWTLTTESGSIQVAGHEYDKGTSNISIIGGTGKYEGISGVMESTNNNDGTFTQILRYRINR
jgi:dirigent-like protein